MLDLLTINWVMSAHAGDIAQSSHRIHHWQGERILSSFYRYAWMNATGFVVVKYRGEWSAYIMENNVPVL